MKIARLITSTALCAAMLFVACSDDMQPDRNTRSDTGFTRPTPEQPQVVPGATDSGRGLTSSRQPDTATTPPSLDDPQIMAWMARLNELSMTRGRLAKAQATHPGVKSFAQKLVDDHIALGNRAKELVKETGIVPMQAINERSDKEMGHALETLKSAPQGSFDSLFLTVEIEGDRKMLDRIKALETDAKNGSLKKDLDETKKVIARHLDQALKLKGTMR